MPEPPVVQASFVAVASPAITALENLLAKYHVDADLRNRVARAIVTSSRKYNVDPKLVASIMIVESRANPFAVSDAESIGIMQIHLPTWGLVADKQGINLFKVEDNVEFGVRILKGYIEQNGLWPGVMRYKGFKEEDPSSHQAANDYVRKVRTIFGGGPRQQQAPTE